MDGSTSRSLPDRISGGAVQALQAYEDAKDEAVAADQTRRKALASVRLAKRRLLALPPGSITADAADALYWDTDIPTGIICHLLGVKGHVEALLPEIGPGTLWNCGAGHTFGERTRSQRDALEAGKGHCPQCRAENNARNWAAIDRRRELTNERVAELRSMRYPEYLRSPEWQATRLAALRRARFRCQMCGAENARLNVHHNTYERRGEELASDVVAICEPCHRLHHGIEVDA